MTSSGTTSIIYEALTVVGVEDMSAHFLETVQDMVEGWMDVEHALRGTGDALPDRLHHGKKQTSDPGWVSPGRTAQHRPLLGSMLPPRICAF